MRSSLPTAPLRPFPAPLSPSGVMRLTYLPYQGELSAILSNTKCFPATRTMNRRRVPLSQRLRIGDVIATAESWLPPPPSVAAS